MHQELGNPTGVALSLNCNISQKSFDLFLTYQSPDLEGDNTLGRRGEPGQLVKVLGESRGEESPQAVLPGAADWDHELWLFRISRQCCCSFSVHCLHSDLLKCFCVVCNALRLSFCKFCCSCLLLQIGFCSEKEL